MNRRMTVFNFRPPALRLGELAAKPTVGGLLDRLRSRMGWQGLSFLTAVLAPTLCASIYYGLIASDRYVAEAQFVVRGVSSRRATGLEIAFLVEHLVVGQRDLAVGGDDLAVADDRRGVVAVASCGSGLTAVRLLKATAAMAFRPVEPSLLGSCAGSGRAPARSYKNQRVCSCRSGLDRDGAHL